MKTIARAIVLASLSLGATLASAAELTFWSWRVEDKAFYDQVSANYKKVSGDDVKFTAYKNTEYPTVLSAALAGGGGPDIIHTRAYGGLSNLSDAGYLLALSPASVPNLANFPEDVLAGSRGNKPPYDQSVYAVPFATQALGILYNKQLLAANGVSSPPKTWDEFKAICKQLKAKGVVALANGVKDAPVLEQVFGIVGPNFYGGTDYFKGVMSGQKKFTDAGFVAAIDEVVRLREFMPPNALGIGEADSRALFAAGQAAFFMTGTWNIETVSQTNAKLDFDMMPAPAQTTGGPAWVSTFADGGYSVNANTKNRAAALKFLNYLASNEYAQHLADELRQLPALPNVRLADKVLGNASQQAREHGTPYIMLVGFRYQNPNGSVMLRDGLQKLLQGQGTSQQLARDIQTGLATWYRPFQK